MSGMLKLGEVNIFGVHRETEGVIRDGLLVLIAFLSMMTTKKEIRDDNEFTWFPMKEVAILFIGIFLTMMPCLKILHTDTCTGFWDNHLFILFMRGSSHVY